MKCTTLAKSALFAHRASASLPSMPAKRRSPLAIPIPPLAQLKAFEAVGRLRGIRRAAQELTLDHGVVSRHVRALEEWAGVRLFDRRQGSLTLTATGARFHGRVAAALEELLDSSSELRRQRAERRLNIWCVPGFASQWLTTRLVAFQHTNPHIQLELHPTDRSPDFDRYEADVDIRFVPGQERIAAARIENGIRRTEIARPAMIAMAAPRLVGRLGKLRAPADLLKAPLLHEDGDQQWREWFQAHGVDPPARLRGPQLWHAHLTLEAARAGQGIALSNKFLVGNDVLTGKLVPVLPQDTSRQVTLGAYVLSARADQWNTPGVSRFRRWLGSVQRTLKTRSDTV
jgi:LysR family glycine cleavage system transcriptional activator